MVILRHDRIRLVLLRSLTLGLALLLCSNMTASADCKPFIIDLYMGEPVPLRAMFDDLCTVRIVYLGEIHTIARHHELEAEVLRGLLDRGLKLALGMEMFAGTAANPGPMATSKREYFRPYYRTRPRPLDQFAGLCKCAYPCT